MKFVSYLDVDSPRLGIIVKDQLYDIHCINPFLSEGMLGFLQQENKGIDYAHLTAEEIENGQYVQKALNNKSIVAPLPNPRSFRNVFNQNPKDQPFPILYFGNHQAIAGEGNIDCMQYHFGKLDFELEIAVVLNKEGRNIRAEHADYYIGGFMILTNFVSRGIQDDESEYSDISAKSMDFGIATGPMLVTPDELEEYRTGKEGHIGNHYQLKAECIVKNETVCEVNSADLPWTFAEIIERASYGTTLYPGDIIGSGKLPGASFQDINSGNKKENDAYKEQWLQPTDHIMVRVEGLGELSNKMCLSAAEISLTDEEG